LPPPFEGVTAAEDGVTEPADEPMEHAALRAWSCRVLTDRSKRDPDPDGSRRTPTTGQVLNPARRMDDAGKRAARQWT
jgi:hypothetical protein